jgi:hypothetical protein
MRRFTLLCLCAILAAAPLAAAAGDLVVTVDPAATKTTFVLRATLHKAEGRVPLKSG